MTKFVNYRSDESKNIIYFSWVNSSAINSACFLSKMLPSDCYLKRGIHRVFMYLRRLK